MRRISGVWVLAALLVWHTGIQAAEGPVMQYDGTIYSGESLPPGIKMSLFELEQEVNTRRTQIFDSWVATKFVEEEAKRQGKSFEQMQQELLGVGQPSEADIKGFYEMNRSRIPGSLDEMRGEIAQYLQNQAALQKQRALIERISREKGYSLDLPEPEPVRVEVKTKGYPSKGPDDAPVTIVEFADYQCPHCKQAGPVVKKLLKQYGDKVRLVFRDYPINRSGVSQKVAEAAVCADEQGYFWPYHDLAFEQQSALGSIGPVRLAEDLGLDMEKFNRCLSAPGTQAKVANSKKEAQQLGLNSTPSFLVNGRLLPHGHSGLEALLIEAIEAELKAADS